MYDCLDVMVIMLAITARKESFIYLFSNWKSLVGISVNTFGETLR